jgi:hypothetical protein
MQGECNSILKQNYFTQNNMGDLIYAGRVYSISKQNYFTQNNMGDLIYAGRVKFNFKTKLLYKEQHGSSDVSRVNQIHF